MTRRVLRCASIAALSGVALTVACAKGDKTADSAKAADSAAATTRAAAPTPAPAAPALSDPNIVALLDAANVADSASGSVAATKGTNPQVRSFGRDMVRDHHALRKMGQDLAKKLNVTPAPPQGDTTATGGAKWHDSLTAMPKGAAFDRAYIDHEVIYHQAVLQTAQTALAATQNAELQALIQKAAPNIQAHLEHAQNIQSKLNGGGGTTGGASGAAGGNGGTADTSGGTKRP